jgi:3-deoxy-D-manno-octulosonic-acid transferase
MMGAVARGAYRGVMRAAAAAAAVAERVPGLPPGWQGIRERLGYLGDDARAMGAGGVAVWLHAASVGELVAVRPLLAGLRERYPERIYVVSTLTRSGLALAREMREVHVALLFPLDAPAAVRRVLEAFRLEAFLFTETEIWPTFLAAIAAAEVPAFMVSGRIGARSADRAAWLRPLYRDALAPVTCCMQTEEDARRVIALGADARRVVVTGSLKFDAPVTAPPPELAPVAAAVGGRRLIVGGSTHAGEDEALLAAWGALVATRPDLRLLLAPRHPERVAAVEALVRATGWRVVRYSALASGAEGSDALATPAVVLLDVVGPLAHCYGLGTVAFVGGSLVPAGGHNVLEPARAGLPVLVGPHTAHAADVVDRLVADGAALRVADGPALRDALGKLLDDTAQAAAIGGRGRAIVASGRGALERHLKIIAARLGSSRFARDGGRS